MPLFLFRNRRPDALLIGPGPSRGSRYGFLHELKCAYCVSLVSERIGKPVVGKTVVFVIIFEIVCRESLSFAFMGGRTIAGKDIDRPLKHPLGCNRIPASIAKSYEVSGEQTPWKIDGCCSGVDNGKEFSLVGIDRVHLQ